MHKYSVHLSEVACEIWKRFDNDKRKSAADTYAAVQCGKRQTTCWSAALSRNLLHCAKLDGTKEDIRKFVRIPATKKYSISEQFYSIAFSTTLPTNN